MAEISMAKARMIIRKAMAKGEELGFKPLSVVVLDSGGHVKAFEREDDAAPGRFAIAHGKAYGAVMLGMAGTAQMARAEQQPYFMLAANVFAAESDEEGAYLRTSMQQAFARMQTGTRGKLPRPVKDIDVAIGERMRRSVEPMLRVSATGSPETVRKHLESLIEIYEPDEMILTGQIHDHAARVKSFEIAADAMDQILAAQSSASINPNPRR